MAVAGIICEYNPFHNGHEKQFRMIRRELGEDTVILCLMSGNYVQRGEPALFHKSVRAQAAVECGANIVFELPFTYSLRSAEGFASGAVDILNKLGICDYLCFGAENPDEILSVADTMSTVTYTEILKEKIIKGISYGAAREEALKELHVNSAVLHYSNNILAVEYLLALRKLDSRILPLPIKRSGAYHAEELDYENPSAEAIRNNSVVHGYVPPKAECIYLRAEKHVLKNGERAMLSVLRSVERENLKIYPYNSEGLWNKVYKEIQKSGDYETIITGVKSKRYPYTRISRMLMCAYLGITDNLLKMNAPWLQVLGFDSTGRSVLKKIKEVSDTVIRNPGEKMNDTEYDRAYQRAELLYPLFSDNIMDAEKTARVFCKK